MNDIDPGGDGGGSGAPGGDFPPIHKSHILALAISESGKVLQRLIQGIVVVFLGYFAYLAVQACAGKDTTAHFGVDALIQVGTWKDVVPWVLSGVFFLWAVGATMLLRRTIRRLTFRSKRFELEMDPTRTTSGLLPDGRSPGKRGNP